MPDPADITSELAVTILPIAVLALAFAAAIFSASLDARTAGQRWTDGARVPVRETARLLRQGRRTIAGSDSLLWRIGGGGLVVVAFLMVAVVPLGRFSFVNLPVGVVWFNAMDVLLWALWWLLGWGANSAYSLVGGYRFLAQALSYEIPLMFALTVPAVGAASLRVTDIVAAQTHLWFIVWMPVAFLVYFFSVAAFSAWGPFASATSPDIAGGIIAELSGVDRLIVLAGRYCLLVAGAAFSVPMFFGGGVGPILPAWAWVLIKTLLVLAALTLLRRRLPGSRPDRLAEITWVVVVPITLLQLLVVALVAPGMRS